MVNQLHTVLYAGLCYYSSCLLMSQLKGYCCRVQLLLLMALAVTHVRL